MRTDVAASQTEPGVGGVPPPLPLTAERRAATPLGAGAGAGAAAAAAGRKWGGQDSTTTGQRRGEEMEGVSAACTRGMLMGTTDGHGAGPRHASLR